MSRTLTHAATEPVSDRNAAWLEELVEAVTRSRGVFLTRLSQATTMGEAALMLHALAELGEGDNTSESLALVDRLTRECVLDVGEAAATLTALARAGHALRLQCANTVYDSLEILLESQNADGGWASSGGPSCPGTTARALEALGCFGFRTRQSIAGAAVKFLLAAQEEGGEWCNLSAVLAGLRSVNFDMYAMPVRRAVRWLKETQNSDGGWGEGGSTGPATAEAMLALLTVHEHTGPETRAAAEYLVGTQRADGNWRDTECGTLPLIALARYVRLTGAGLEM